MSYITIYFGDKPVFLCDKISKEIEQYRHRPGSVFINKLSIAKSNSLLKESSKEEFTSAIITGENLDKLKTDFFKNFHLIKAAGGVVKNEKEEILMIFRRGKWDLPKGKLEKDETLKECAKREVAEETGLQKLEVIKPITITYHTYFQFGKHNLKESHWYEMKASKNEKLIPQTEEDINEIIWAKKENLQKFFSNTYPAIVDVLKREI
jgi:8-oxo-dGTP pyrophosphatase MutT (NUDIX family)